SGDSGSVLVLVHAGNSGGGAVVAEATVPVSAGTWSSTPAVLADGTYTVQATQADQAGKSGASGAQTFTVDTIGPAVSLNSVRSPTNDAPPTLGGAGGSAPRDLSSVTVTVYAGTSAGGSVAATGVVPVSGGSWPYT